MYAFGRCHASARLAQPAERKALNLVVVGSSPTVGVALVVVGSSPTVGVAIAGVGIRGPCAPCHVQSALCIPRGGFWSGDPAAFSMSTGMTSILPGLLSLFFVFFRTKQTNLPVILAALGCGHVLEQGGRHCHPPGAHVSGPTHGFSYPVVKK